MNPERGTTKVIFLVKDLEDWQKAAEALLDFAEEKRKFFFSGEVGAGKTTFIQALCRQLEISDTVQSPTFSLINEYYSALLDQPVFHIDLYRLRTADEALDIGMLEQLDHPWYTFIEWPELIASFAADEAVQIHIELMENSDRKVVFLRSI